MDKGILWKESLWGWFDATDFVCYRHVYSAGEPCWAAFPVGIIALGERVRKLTSIEPLQLKLHTALPSLLVFPVVEHQELKWLKQSCPPLRTALCL